MNVVLHGGATRGSLTWYVGHPLPLWPKYKYRAYCRSFSLLFLSFMHNSIIHNLIYQSDTESISTMTSYPFTFRVAQIVGISGAAWLGGMQDPPLPSIHPRERLNEMDRKHCRIKSEYYACFATITQGRATPFHYSSEAMEKYV